MLGACGAFNAFEPCVMNEMCEEESMSKALLLLAQGFEESEALITATYLRRAGIELDLVTIQDELEVEGAHQIIVSADKTLDEIDLETYDALVTPGGLPGATNLAEDERVRSAVKTFYEQKKVLAHICASPALLKAAGIAQDIEGVCYPGFEGQVDYKQAHEDIVFVDGEVITSRGPLTTPWFAFKIIEKLEGSQKAEDVAGQVLLPLVQKAM